MLPRRRHTIVVSDVHLSQAHPEDPTDPLWMRYRRRDHHPDPEFASLVDHLLATRGKDSLELVFNGDVFDFDAPWVKDGTSSFEEFPPTDQGCADHIRRIIRDHEPWFRAVARLLLAGHRLLVMSGNHDVELYFPGVRQAVREELGRLAALESPDGRGLSAHDLEARVRFRAWFHLTEDGLYIEHGSQYDIFSCVRYPMLPLTRTRNWIHPQMGKLAFKRTGSRMGYFNPYYEETFYLGFTGYMAHWYRFYARSHRHIMRTWLRGGVSTALEIWRHRHHEDWRRENNELACAETGASEEAIDATLSLGARPAEHTMVPILRELWFDRVALVALVLLSTLVGFLAGGLHAGTIAGAVALAMVVLYELLTPKPDLRTYDTAPPEVRRIFDIHGVRAICLGHTHRPFGTWEEDETPSRFYGNGGSWCPAFRDQECTQPVLPTRPLLLLSSEGDAMWGGLHWWDGQRLVAESTAMPEPSAPRRATPEPAASETTASELRPSGSSAAVESVP